MVKKKEGSVDLVEWLALPVKHPAWGLHKGGIKGKKDCPKDSKAAIRN